METRCGDRHRRLSATTGGQDRAREVSPRPNSEAKNRPNWRYSKRRQATMTPFEHIWEFDLPEVADRWLVVDAERIDGGHVGNVFQFSFASQPDGPLHAGVFCLRCRCCSSRRVADRASRQALSSKRKAAIGRSPAASPDQLAVDAMAISYRDTIGPFAQGDLVVSFINLLNEATRADCALSPGFGCHRSRPVRQFARRHPRRHHQARPTSKAFCSWTC